MPQHKATKRQSLRSALCHRRLANELLDSIADSQAKWNLTMAKLDADTDGAIATDYASSNPIIDVFDPDHEGEEAQHKRTLRQTLRSALSHRRLADEIADALEEQQVAYNLFLAKLDADSATADGDYESTANITPLDPDHEGEEAQHKRSFRESLRSALCHRRLADEIIDAITDLQNQMNTSFADIDANAGAVNGRHSGFTVTELEPDS